MVIILRIVAYKYVNMLTDYVYIYLDRWVKGVI